MIHLDRKEKMILTVGMITVIKVNSKVEYCYTFQGPFSVEISFLRSHHSHTSFLQTMYSVCLEFCYLEQPNNYYWKFTHKIQIVDFFHKYYILIMICQILTQGLYYFPYGGPHMLWYYNQSKVRKGHFCLKIMKSK